MPIQGGPSNHPQPSAASLPIVTREIPVTAVGANNTVDLFADNLPGLSAWFWWDTNVAMLPTVQLQFAFGQNAGSINWQNLVPPYPLAFATASLVTFRLGSRRYRAVITCAAAGVLRYRLAAALT